MTITSARQDASEGIRVGVLVSVWSTLLYVSKMSMAINWDSLKELPTVVTVYATLSYIFTKWLWRMPFLQGWAIPFPDLQGTWQGEIRSTRNDPQNGPCSEPVAVILVIKQSYSTLSCTMRSSNSDSRSTAAQLSIDSDGTVRLTYNYINRPRATVRDQIPMHDGAAILRLVLRPKRCLEGEYWTNHRTLGDISVQFRSRALLEEFPLSASW